MSLSHTFVRLHQVVQKTTQRIARKLPPGSFQKYEKSSYLCMEPAHKKSGKAYTFVLHCAAWSIKKDKQKGTTGGTSR